MSDTATIFADLNQLALRLGTLLSSRTAGKAPEVARKLRAEKQLKVAIASLINVLEGLANATKALEKPLEKTAEIAAGCEAIADSFDAFGDGKSLGQVAKLCGQSDAMVQPIVDKIVQVRGPLVKALGMLGSLPTPSQLTELCKNLTDLADDLQTIALKVEDPNAPTSTPTPTSPGGKLP
jgi:hypothetical protein